MSAHRTCCCGQGPSCGSVSPLCGVLRAGIEACAEFNLGGRFLFEATLHSYGYTLSRDYTTYQAQPGGYTHWVSRSSCELIQPATWVYTVAYCPETGNWMACWESGFNPQELYIYTEYESDHCFSTSTRRACTPPMDNSSPNYEEGDVTKIVAAGVNRAQGGWRMAAPLSCRGANVPSSMRLAPFDAYPAAWTTSGSSPNAYNFISTHEPQRLTGAITGIASLACGTTPYTFEGESDYHSFDALVEPDGGPDPSAYLVARDAPASPPSGYTYNTSVTGGITVAESASGAVFTRTINTDFGYSYAAEGPGLRFENIDATGQGSATVKFTRLDDCGQAPPLPPGLDENGQPAKQPGQCAGCGQ